MTSRIRVLAVSAIVLLGMTAQAQACFWPFCCGGGYGRACAWGGPVGYGRTVGYRRGFYAGYYSASSCCSPCSTCGTCGGGGCSSCGVSTYYGGSYYGSGCCSTCGSSSCSGCSTCGGGSCSNCSTNYYPDGSSSSSTGTSTYSNTDDNPTDATTTNPRDDDFGPGNRSTDNSVESTTEEDEADSSIPDDFQTPIAPPPGDPTNGDDDPTAEPLNIGPQLTWQVLPTRSRVHVEADIRAPRVARVDAAPAAAPDLSILRVASFEE